MKDEQYIINGFTFKRVDKKKARAVFNNDLVLILLPSKTPMSIKNMGMHVWRKRYGNFDRVVAEFQSRNCNSSVGTDVKYFVPVVVNSFNIEEYDYNYHNLT